MAFILAGEVKLKTWGTIFEKRWQPRPALILIATLSTIPLSNAKGEPITGEIYAGAAIDAERRASLAGSTPSDLESIGPQAGVDLLWGNFAFGGVFEGRRTKGDFGAGVFTTDVKARGGSIEAYGAYQVLPDIVPGFFLGLGGTYSYDKGNARAFGASADLTLKSTELSPFAYYFIPVGKGAAEFTLTINALESRLEIQGTPTEKLSARETTLLAQYRAPVFGGINIMAGLEGRYSFKEEPGLGSAARDTVSVKALTGLRIGITVDTILDIEGEIRAFDEVIDETSFTVKLRKAF